MTSRSNDAEIEEEMNSKRTNLLNSMQECSRMNPLLGNVYLDDISSDDTSATTNLEYLKKQVEKRLATNIYSNNSFDWDTNLNNITFPELNSIDIAKDRAVLNRFLNTDRKESQIGFKDIASRSKTNIYYPQHNLNVGESSSKAGQSSDESNRKNHLNVFKKAGDLLDLNEIKKLASTYNMGNVAQQKTILQKNKSSKFIPPLLNKPSEGVSKDLEPEDERLKNIDPKIIELIQSEIMDTGSKVEWDDIAGLQFAKTAIKEAVVWPMLRPDIFTGLRRPPKGILLFGPPGTGKTLIGKCVASQSKSTFFSISASSLTSKWVGEGEKMVRALFTIARCHQPAVIFIDEIDSLLSQRSESEHESSRRIKTEFLVQLDGARTDSEERLLIIGATNRPQELDEAARRRFVKRLYIPLPEDEGRLQLLKKLMQTEKNSLSEANFLELARLSDGYSGADIKNLCSDACLGPIRCMNFSEIENINITEVRPVSIEDFTNSLARVRSSVSPNDLEQYVLWDNTYGSGSGF